MKGLQDIFQSIAANSCLGLCYAKYLKPFDLDSTLMKCVIDGWRKDLISDDGAVLDAEKYLHLIDDAGRYFSVQKVQISSFNDLGDEPMPCLFSMDEGKSGHWCLCNKDGIVWNSLEKSINVRYGKLCSLRKITTN